MNRALRIHGYGGPAAVQIDALEIPQAGPGEVLVRVHAAGINGLDWKLSDGLLQEAFPLNFPATLGVELAGEVAELGAGVTGFAVGNRVLGTLGGLGAYADYVVVSAALLAPIPAQLDYAHAAAIPVTGLTAWQALFDLGGLQAGQTVLIHGAAGGVGCFAVQFARRAGARVIVTARGMHTEYLLGLGAHQVIDYQTQAFWERCADVDLVLDLVGGNALAHSWQVLGQDGKIVTTAEPGIAAQVPIGKSGAWLQVRPDVARLTQIATQVAAGELNVTLSETCELADAGAAIERNKTGHGAGKAVVHFLA